MKSEKLDFDVLMFDCPKCGARIGEPCKGAGEILGDYKVVACVKRAHLASDGKNSGDE